MNLPLVPQVSPLKLPHPVPLPQGEREPEAWRMSNTAEGEACVQPGVNTEDDSRVRLQRLPGLTSLSGFRHRLGIPAVFPL